MSATFFIIPILFIGIWQPTTLQRIPLYLDPVTTAPLLSPSIADIGSNHSYKLCGSDKVCVQSNLCWHGKINKYGSTIFDIRCEMDKEDQAYNGPLFVDDEPKCPLNETCCSIEDNDDIDDVTQATTVKMQRTIETNAPPSTCGFGNPNGISFKFEGADNSNAKFAEFPWVVAIMIEFKVYKWLHYRYQCGGSLVTPNVVLTSASCMSTDNTFIARAGEWQSFSKNEPLPLQNRKVIKIVRHEGYNKLSLHNDMALLFLESPFDLAPNVQTICLPEAGSNFYSSQCYVAGWGKYQLDGRYSHILKKVALPVIPNNECEKKLRKTRLSKYFKLHSNFMCAGGELGTGTCTGDGGSPLMCPFKDSPNRFVQAGIVAWGIGCGGENIPEVYVSVFQLRGWIDKQLADTDVISTTLKNKISITDLLTYIA